MTPTSIVSEDNVKTLAQLANTFRVGRKIWCTNNATVSRLLACVAYNLAVGYNNENRNTAWTYGMFSRDCKLWPMVTSGLRHPDFASIAMRLLIEDSSNGVIWKREVKTGDSYAYVSAYYQRHDKFAAQSISADSFNQEGPRTFLSERQLRQYFAQCICNASGLIADILEYDRELDALDEMLDDCHEDYCGD